MLSAGPKKYRGVRQWHLDFHDSKILYVYIFTKHKHYCTDWFPEKLKEVLDERRKYYTFAGDAVSKIVTVLFRCGIYPATKSVSQHEIKTFHFAVVFLIYGFRLKKQPIERLKIFNSVYTRD